MGDPGRAGERAPDGADGSAGELAEPGSGRAGDAGARESATGGGRDPS